LLARLRIYNPWQTISETSKVKGWKGLKAINRRMKDYYESSRRQQEQAEARRPQAPITLPKFKCLEDGK
jgi:hypothetical protein